MIKEFSSFRSINFTVLYFQKNLLVTRSAFFRDRESYLVFHGNSNLAGVVLWSHSAAPEFDVCDVYIDNIFVISHGHKFIHHPFHYKYEGENASTAGKVTTDSLEPVIAIVNIYIIVSFHTAHLGSLVTRNKHFSCDDGLWQIFSFILKHNGQFTQCQTISIVKTHIFYPIRSSQQ